MVDFLTRVSDGIGRASRHVELAAVPFVLAVVALDNVGAVLGYSGLHVGIRFGFPAGVLDPWHFVDVPAGGGVSVRTGSLLLLPVTIVLRGVLGAGYFGSIRDLLVDGEYDFVANAGRYAGQFLVLAAIPILATAALGVVAVVPGGVVLVLLALPAYLVAGYLFFATPYLVVLRETDLVSAARGSYELAVDGGPYAAYAGGYLGLLVVSSAAATAVVVNFTILGLVVGIPALSVFGLGLNVATMRFVADVDGASPDAGRWAGEHLGSGGPDAGGSTVDSGGATGDLGGAASDDPVDGAVHDPTGDVDEDVSYGLGDDWGADDDGGSAEDAGPGRDDR